MGTEVGREAGREAGRGVGREEDARDEECEGGRVPGWWVELKEEPRLGG